MLLGPPLILFIGFVFVPMIFAIWYSLYNWNGYGPLSDFIGLQNYQGVVTGSVFHQALLHNIIIAVLSVVIQLPISIGLALLLNRRMRGQTALRLAVFTPYVLSQATSAVMWSMLLSHGGPVDSLLKSAGLGRLDPLLAGQHLAGALHAVLRGHLAVHRLRDRPAAGRPAGYPARAARGRGHRRCLVMADNQADHAAAARPHDQDLDLPGGHRLAPALRHRLDHDTGRPANASQTMLTYLYFNGAERTQFGYGATVSVVLFIISFVFALAYQRYRAAPGHRRGSDESSGVR